jgi:chromosomal replication initiator protein
MENAWEKICLTLAEIIPKDDYNVWIYPQKGIFEDETLTVMGSNAFVAKFLREHFQSSILRAANLALGREIAVRITFASAYNGSIPEGFMSSPAVPSAASTTPSASGPEEKQAQPCQPEHQPDYQPEYQPEYQTDGQQQLPVRWNWDAPQPSAESGKWRYSFDNFVVGSCNAFAHAAAQRMCQSAGASSGSVDLLFLSSAPGLGKTHLMQSVGAGLMKHSNRRAPKVEYLTAEGFATLMYQAIQSREMYRFKARFREIDVLLLENVHFLLNKTATQEELLATLISLLAKGSRVVFSSSFALPELSKMDSQLFSRLRSGLVAPIDPLDKETSRRIITCKATAADVKLSDDVTDYLTDNIHSDVRQIESCLKTLILKARLFNRAISMDMAREVVVNCLGTASVFTLPGIIQLICEAFGVSADTLGSKSRKQELVNARNAVFYLARRHTQLSLQEIGSRFKRNHSTVIKGITSFEREISRQTHTGRQFAGVIERIEQYAGLDKTQVSAG